MQGSHFTLKKYFYKTYIQIRVSKFLMDLQKTIHIMLHDFSKAT